MSSSPYAVIHAKSGAAVTIGESTSIAHSAIVHGPCKVGSQVFIGFKSVPVNVKSFSEDVVRRNVDLVRGYKKLANEF